MSNTQAPAPTTAYPGPPAPPAAAPAPSATAARPPRGPTSSGRGRRQRRTGPVVAPPPRVPPPTQAAVPQFLSTHDSTMRNDPFIMDEFEVDGLDLRPVDIRPQFDVEHAGFMDLIEATYDELCLADRHFRTNLPFSVYAYYNSQLLHARLNELDKLHHRPYHIVYDQTMFSVPFSVHEVIGRYLDSLGEFKSPDGENFRFAALHVPVSALGDFGQYDPDTAPAYHQAPAPALMLQAIQADVTVPHVPDWQPAGMLAPALVANQVAVPNGNLLGYYRSVAPQQRDRPVYARLGFTANQLPTDTFTKFRVSPSVMQHSSSVIAGLTDKVRVKSTHPGIPAGSICQMAYQCNRTPDAVLRGAKLTLQELATVSRHQLAARSSNGSFIACFRIRRDERQDGTLTGIGYTWHATANPAVEVPPPAGYAQHINDVFTAHLNGRLNSEYFDSNSILRGFALRDVIKQFAK